MLNKLLACWVEVHRTTHDRAGPGRGPVPAATESYAVCELDLEGMVVKHKDSPYLSERTTSMWYQIRNPGYSQMIGRHELFERERHNEPVPGWHGCDLACAELDDAKP